MEERKGGKGAVRKGEGGKGRRIEGAGWGKEQRGREDEGEEEVR